MPRKVRQRVTIKRKRHRGGGFLPGMVALMAARKANKRKRQKGGALARRRPRLVDKIAEGASMFLSGPALSFAGVGIKLESQAFKGIKDNVDHYRRRKRR